MDKKKERQAELSERLNQALKIRGMRAVDLCERTGVPKGAISYYLAGKSQPKSDRLYQISKALDVSEAWLLGFDVPMERTPEQKKNDDLVKVVGMLRRNPDLFEVVNLLAALPTEDYDRVKVIITALLQK